RILEAAMALFVERGFADVAMRQIAERSGVTKSLIHHHFGSKEALWEEVKDLAFSHYIEQQKPELEQTPVADETLLRNGVIRYFRFLADNPQVVRLLGWIHMEGDETCGEREGEMIALGAERIREAQRAGIFRADINPVHAVTLFVMTCGQWFHGRAHHSQWPGIGSDEEFLDDFLKIFIDGLRAGD
ncbi:MAG: TetR/AcrR family transcriptional regulator, partial [Wenzhouxiangellaceae bacterium]